MASGWRWDLVGLPWAEAEPMLQARGSVYETVITAPPGRAEAGVGVLRVVAEQPGSAGLRIVLAYRDYPKADGRVAPHMSGGVEGRA